METGSRHRRRLSMARPSREDLERAAALFSTLSTIDHISCTDLCAYSLSNLRAVDNNDGISA